MDLPLNNSLTTTCLSLDRLEEARIDGESCVEYSIINLGVCQSTSKTPTSYSKELSPLNNFTLLLPLNPLPTFSTTFSLTLTPSPATTKNVSICKKGRVGSKGGNVSEESSHVSIMITLIQESPIFINSPSDRALRDFPSSSLIKSLL